jgi:hypothetical protein
MKTKLISCLIAVMMLTGCTTFGPGIVRSEQRPYNEALVHSWKEQLLLNLVRLKYRDDPYFLEVTSIVSNHTLNLTASATAKFPEMSKPISQSVTAGVGYTNQPVISYVPLQGPAYVKKLLSPVPLKMILALANSGWSIETVLDICVQEINGVFNAVSAAAPTPETTPEYKEFEYLAHNLRILQLANLIAAGEDPFHDPLAPESIVDPGKDLYMKIIRGRGHDKTIREVMETMRLDPQVDLYLLSTNPLSPDSPSKIKIRTRTFLGVLYYLSQSVQVPQAHIDAGLVTVTMCEDGKPCDWSEIIGEDMRIYSSCYEPECAAVKICYGGYWFYIDDRDLNSKSTFMLLSKLFNFQSDTGCCNSPAPQLTIPLK